MTTKRASFMWFHKGIKFVLTISPQKFSQKNFNIFLLAAWDLKKKCAQADYRKKLPAYSCCCIIILDDLIIYVGNNFTGASMHTLAITQNGAVIIFQVTGHSYCSQWHYIAIMGTFISSCRKQLFLL